MALKQEEINKLLSEGRAVSDAPAFAESLKFEDSPITSQDFEETSTPDGLLAQPQQDNIPDISTLNTDFVPLQKTQSQQEFSSGLSTLDELNKLISGESTFRSEKQKELGVPEQEANIRDLSSRLKAIQNESKSIPLQLQQEIAGRGVTTGGLAPIQSARLRTNAIQALGVSSLLEAAQGNLATALDQVDRATELKFGQVKAEKQQLIERLDLLSKSPETSRQEKNSALKQQAIQEAQLREIEKKEALETEIKKFAVNAASLGADSNTLNKIMEAESFKDVVSAARTYLQDPTVKLELQKLGLDIVAKKQQIETNAYQLDLLKKYGGLSPIEYAKELREEQKRIDTEEDQAEKAVLQGEAIQEKINLIDVLLDSNALDSVVGTTPLTRGPFRSSGIIQKASTFINPTSFFGLVDEFLGSDDVVGLTEQLVSKEFLQNLIDVKARGATFGALQKAEQDALTNAAIAIGNARIYSGSGEEKKVIGYDMSESEFKRQMNIIKSSSEIAYQRSTGKSFTPEEQAVFDTMRENEDLLNFNPSF